ncbi:MAG: type II secretion system F family protein [Planctomycetes bacterium]|nr:type II secretion system F family protein [Planctomycetota bacterium]
MPKFQYEAMNAQGQAMRDQIDAQSTEDAIAKIRAKGLFPTDVREVREKKRGKVSIKKKAVGKTIAFGGVRSKQLTQFTRQLSTLQDAGLPIVKSVKILEGQLKPGVLKNVLISVAEDIESGANFSEALAKHPRAFDKLYVNMVKAGEAGGVLDAILQRLADFREKSAKLKRQIVGAMVYPAVVVTIASVILTGIMIFIIPKFKSMFDDLGIRLPGLTQALISFAEWVKSYWFLIPGIPVGFYILLKLICLSAAGRYGVDWLKLRLPIFGNIIRKSVIARFTRTLGTLVGSGVPILESLNIVRETTGNAVMANAIGNVHDNIREGGTVADPLAQSGICDEMVVNMIDVGEETGDLDKMLLKIADTYDEEVDVAVGAMVSLLEPLMIVVMGGAVGFIVISLFLPLIELLNKIGSTAG